MLISGAMIAQTDCMMDGKDRVCIIGAGPAGLLTLRRFLQLGDHSPEVVCYEKQSTWGGQWTFTPNIGTDEYGEPIHSSMYKNLWSNIPKECMQIPEYTFDDHFGRPTPSCFSVPVVREYLQGLIKRCPAMVEDFIRYNTVVREVQYDKASDQFIVQISHLPTGKSETQTYSHVIVASGIFSTPFLPDIDGLDDFPGLVLHSHYVKRSEMFRNRRVLLIGSMFSAEDIAAHCMKYGADHVIISYHRVSRNFNWPTGIEERPMVTGVTKDVVTFKDGTVAKVDTIILCTGYIYNYPFLEDSLRLDKERTSLFPRNLYKGVVWLKGGNQKLLYVGSQVPIHTLALVDIQAVWSVRYITGINPLNGRRLSAQTSIIEKSEKEIGEELEHQQTQLKAVSCIFEALPFQREYLQPLADELGYDIDLAKYDECVTINLNDRARDIMTYRDCQVTSPVTGVESPVPKVPWVQQFDDSLEEFLK